MDAILGELTVRQRRKKLEEMTNGNGLGDVYTATLRRLKAQKGNKSILGLKVLMWVLHVERPLRAQGLCHALGVEIGSSDLDFENVPAFQTLLASCLGLVTIEPSSSIIRLVHFTLQEHLASDPSLFPSPHSTIAEICLTYLIFTSAIGLSPIFDSPPSTMPLLDYASCFWGKHAKREMTEYAKILALKLLDRFDQHISARILLLSRNEDGSPGPYYFRAIHRASGFTGLHGLAFFGIAEIVVAAFEMREWNVNARDSMGSTALAWAAARGHEEVVKILLERGDVNPNQADMYDRTPLSWAAQCGHERVVKMLLERGDVNPNKANPYYGKTPLALAAECGHEGVVKMLLERRDICLGQVDTKYRMPAPTEVVGRRHGLIKAKYCRTTLSAGPECRYQRAVKGLPKPEYNHANPFNSRTILTLAAEHGHERVVKMLLEHRDVDPNQADTEYDRTPLGWAAEHGHESVVQMLLKRGDINPNQADQYGRTPLRWAAKGGSEGVAKMLLQRADVNPNLADTHHGRTPLLLAARHGCEPVVKMLLERRDVDPNLADTKYGRTPLWWAARNGHEKVVKMLLERSDLNPNRGDIKYGRTPLWWAAKGGHEGIVKMLLQRGDINPNQADTGTGRTPLSWAVEHGNEGVVKLLSELKDSYTAKTYTPLAFPRGYNSAATIQEWGYPKSDRADHSSLARYSPSVPHGDECVVEMQPRGSGPNIGIRDLNAQPILPPADPNERDLVLDLEDSTPKLLEGGLSSTIKSVPPKPPSAEIQPKGGGPNIGIRDLNAQPTLQPADPDERNLGLVLEDSTPKLLEGGLSSTIESVPPKPPSAWRLKFKRLRMKIRTRFKHH